MYFDGEVGEAMPGWGKHFLFRLLVSFVHQRLTCRDSNSHKVRKRISSWKLVSRRRAELLRIPESTAFAGILTAVWAFQYIHLEFGWIWRIALLCSKSWYFNEFNLSELFVLFNSKLPLTLTVDPCRCEHLCWLGPFCYLQESPAWKQSQALRCRMIPSLFDSIWLWVQK